MTRNKKKDLNKRLFELRMIRKDKIRFKIGPKEVWYTQEEFNESLEFFKKLQSYRKANMFI